MEEKRKIRMPIGAAVACLLIVALLTVGIVAGARFINNSLSASQTEKNASAQATSFRLKRHRRFIRRQDRRPSF